MKREKTEAMENSFNDALKDSIQKIRGAVEQGLSFDEACSLIAVKDPGLRESIINDALKAIVAEMHFSRGLPLKNLAMRLRLSLSRLLNAKEGMPGESGEVASAKRRKGSQVA
ncbi:MAG: hypothetical protein M1508_09815 [Nitrospirae bacterium]|nr:hypothetical protein [Nitrospirota bacterium]